MKKKIFIFLFDGFSDWEIAFLTPELKKNKEFELIYFSKDGSSVYNNSEWYCPHRICQRSIYQIESF